MEALCNLKKYDSIISLPANKGRATILNKKEYDEKARLILWEKRPYKYLQKQSD